MSTVIPRSIMIQGTLKKLWNERGSCVGIHFILPSLPFRVENDTCETTYSILEIILLHLLFLYSVQVKNIGFTGVFRLIFKPLVDEFPCFGAVCFSLRQKVPHKFLLVIEQKNPRSLSSSKYDETLTIS